MRLKLYICITMLFLLILGCSMDTFQKEIEEVYNASGVSSIVVINEVGNIKIVPGSDNVIRVKASLRSWNQNDIDQTEISVSYGSTMTFATIIKSDFQRVIVDYEIQIPNNTLSVSATTKTGNIEITGASTIQRLSADYADINVSLDNITTSGTFHIGSSSREDYIIGNVRVNINSSLNCYIHVRIIDGSFTNHGLAITGDCLTTYGTLGTGSSYTAWGISIYVDKGNVDLYPK